MRHRVQHRFGAHALLAVEERNHEGFELRTLEHQAADEIRAAVAEESAAHHLDGAQPAAGASREHIVHPPRDQLRIARRIGKGHLQLRDPQRPLDDERLHRPRAGEALVYGLGRRHHRARAAEAILDRFPLAVMDAPLRRVQIGQRQVCLVAAVNGRPVERRDF